jgi:hypothetical protein
MSTQGMSSQVRCTCVHSLEGRSELNHPHMHALVGEQARRRRLLRVADAVAQRAAARVATHDVEIVALQRRCEHGPIGVSRAASARGYAPTSSMPRVSKPDGKHAR